MWATGFPVLGLESHPVPWCIVCGDRPIQDVYDTLDSMGFDRRDVCVIPAFGTNQRTRGTIMGEIEASGAKFVLWEGFDMIVKNPCSTGEVRDTLSEMTAYCEDGLTILGTVGVAKLKPHETYQNPRQLVNGTSLWERATSTNLVIVPTKPWAIRHPQRLMYASLKNHASFAVLGCFDESGMLVFDSHQDQLSDIAMQGIMEGMLRKHRNGRSG